MKSFFSKITFRSTLYIVMILLLTSLTAYLAIVIVEVRNRELQHTVDNLASRDNTFRSLSLISKYQLIRKIQSSKNDTENYKDEIRLQLSRGNTLPTENQDLNYIEKTGIYTVNFLNYLMGFSPIKDFRVSDTQKYLEQAHIFELQRNYLAAYESFSKVLQLTENKSDDYYFALLHQSFCLSLLDKRSEAVSGLKIVIENAKSEELKLTAEILRLMIEGLYQDMLEITDLKDSELKGERYYKLALYRSAIRVYENIGLTNLSVRAKYFRARSYEELGQYDTAISEYLEITADKRDRKVQLQAQRRILLLSAIYSSSNESLNSKIKNLKVTIDQEFEDYLQKQTPLIEATRLKLSRHTESVKNEIEASEIKLGNSNVTSYEKILENIIPGEIKQLAQKFEQQSQEKFEKEKKEKAAQKSGGGSAGSKLLNAPSSLSMAEKKKLIAEFKQIDKILTKDGSSFTGVIMLENENEVYVFTVLGKVKISKENISSRTRVLNSIQ